MIVGVTGLPPGLVVIGSASIGQLAYTLVDEIVDIVSSIVGGIMCLSCDGVDRTVGIIDRINYVFNSVDQASAVGIVFGLLSSGTQQCIHIKMLSCMVFTCCKDIKSERTIGIEEFRAPCQLESRLQPSRMIVVGFGDNISVDVAMEESREVGFDSVTCLMGCSVGFFDLSVGKRGQG